MAFTKPDLPSGQDIGGTREPAARGKKRNAMPPAARRALEEAELRRSVHEANIAAMPAEIGGRKGPEPIRYGDWESKGITSDF